jgi:hypothetical protein
MNHRNLPVNQLMIVPSDADYKETKLIKAGEKCLSAPFRELAEWIASEFEVVAPLNIIYDTIEPGSRPRLNIILERKRDEENFRINGYGNFDPVRQARIGTKFKEIVASQQPNTFKASELFVIFSAFEPVARTEANWSIPGEKIEKLKKELGSEIWEIRPSFEEVVFFFHSDAELEAWRNSGIRNACIEGYSKLLSQYDQFGYLGDQPIEVFFDSKETFDTKYKGNWFYYDRR